MYVCTAKTKSPADLSMCKFCVSPPLIVNFVVVFNSETDSRGLLHKTFTGEKTPVKSEKSGKHNVTIDFTIGKKLRLK